MVDISDFIETWWMSVRPLLEEKGVIGRLEKSPADRLKPSCVLNLRRDGQEADLIAWHSGEAELITIGPGGVSGQEHFDNVRSLAVLSTILSNIVSAVS
jgi:hypothetical protein